MKQSIRFLVCLCLIVSIYAVGQAQKPELVVESGHSWEVIALAFSPDGKTLASGSRDQTVKLWDVATGAELRILKGHSDIYSVAFSPNGKILAVDDGGTVKLWDLTTGAELRTIETGSVNSVAFSPDGKILACGSTKGRRLWDVLNGAELVPLKGDSCNVVSLAFSPDGKTFASGCYEGILKVWDISTGAELQTLKGQFEINSVVFLPDGTILATDETSGIKKARLWNLSTGAELRTFKIDNDVKSVALSRDGKFLAGGTDRTVKLWDVSTGLELRTLKGSAAWIQSIVFSPDARTIASGSPDGTVRLSDVSTGMELRTLKGGSGWVESIAFSPDGRTLASGSSNGTVHLWDMLSDADPSTLKTKFVLSVSFGPDGKILATGSYMGEAKLWNVSTRAEVRSIRGHPASDGSAVFSPDGNILASGSDDGTVNLWNVSTGAEVRTLKGHSNSIEAVVFSPDGRILARGTLDHTVKLWDVSTGAELRTLKGHSNDVHAVAFSRDGKILASGSYDKTVKLWDVSTGVELRTLKGHSGAVLAVAFSPDGKVLATGSEDGTVKLWDPSTGVEVRALMGHSARVNSVVFSLDNKHLVSGGRDATLKLWDVSSGKELATLIALDQNDWLVVTPDGLFDGSPAAWNKILWRFKNNTFDHAPVQAFFNEFYYPGLLPDIFAGKHPTAPSDISQKDRRQPQLKLTLADVQSDTKLAARNVTIKIAVSEMPADKEHKASSGAQDVRLFRNGSLVKVWRGDVLKRQGSVRLEVTIPIVAGENKLTAYAFNHDDIKSSDVELTINGAESLKRNGTAYILAVGINNYSNRDYNLKYAVADAQDFSEEVKRQQELLKRYAKVEIIPLADAEAKKTNIMHQLAELAARVQPEDTVIVYFAGHGTAHGNEFYLIPHDLGYDGPRDKLNEAGLQKILAHSISDRDLEKLFEGIDAAQLLLVIDACNSGQALEAEEKRRGPMNSKGLAQLAYEKGMYVLTAAQSYQAAQEAEKFGHGFLTYALVEEGLKQGIADREPKDGTINLREWLNYATDEVPRMQEDTLAGLRGRGRYINFRGDGSQATGPNQNGIQRPRIFYRRELELNPFVVAIVRTTAPQ